MNICRYLSQADALTLSRVTEGLLRTGRYLDVAEHLVQMLRDSVLLPEDHDLGSFVELNTRVIYSMPSRRKLACFDMLCPTNGDINLAEPFIRSPLALALIGAPVPGTVACVSAYGVDSIEVLRVGPLGMLLDDAALDDITAAEGQA